MVELVLMMRANCGVGAIALASVLSGCGSEANPVSDGSGDRGGPPWNECASFTGYACCAWGCALPNDPRACLYDVPPGIPGLSTRSDYSECFGEAPSAEGVSREGPPPCEKSTSNVAECQAIIDCIRKKGGVDALAALGYPPPSPGTMMCPPMPGADLDAAMNIDAAPTPDAAASKLDGATETDAAPTPDAAASSTDDGG